MRCDAALQPRAAAGGAVCARRAHPVAVPAGGLAAAAAHRLRRTGCGGREGLLHCTAGGAGLCHGTGAGHVPGRDGPTGTVLYCTVLYRTVQYRTVQVAEWATRAFILHGGEPRLLYPSSSQGLAGPFPHTSQFLSPGHQSFHPSVQSTPMPGPPTGPYSSTGPYSTAGPPSSYSSTGPPTGYSSPYHSHQPQPELQFSPRHNGLYLFLSRLLRPVWGGPLVVGPETSPSSSVSGPELEAVTAQLHDLAAFLDRNSTASLDMSLGGAGPQSRPGPDSQALLREKQSLLVVRSLLGDCLQLLGLWSLVVDHQVAAVVSKLPAEVAASLRHAAFRDLVVRPEGRELAASLVHCLVETYLRDSASTDPISARLRAVCPGLYTAEDSTSSKVLVGFICILYSFVLFSPRCWSFSWRPPSRARLGRGRGWWRRLSH